MVEGQQSPGPARRVRRIRQERHPDRATRRVDGRHPQRGRTPRLRLGLLAVRRRFRRLGHGEATVGRADQEGADSLGDVQKID